MNEAQTDDAKRFPLNPNLEKYTVLTDFLAAHGYMREEPLAREGRGGISVDHGGIRDMPLKGVVIKDHRFYVPDVFFGSEIHEFIGNVLEHKLGVVFT